MFVDFGVVRFAMFFNRSLQASICLANIGAGATRACEFVNNRTSERFRGNIFHTKEGIGGGGGIP